jgi:hypothetical protein
MTSARVCVARRSGAGAKRTRGEDSVSTAWVTSDKTRQQAARDESMTPRSIRTAGDRAARGSTWTIQINSAFSSGPGSTSKTMFVSSDFALPSARSIPTSGCSPLRPRAPPAFTAPPAPPASPSQFRRRRPRHFRRERVARRRRSVCVFVLASASASAFAFASSAFASSSAFLLV